MKTLEERFHEKYMIEPNSGCWLWEAALNSSGYGSIRVDGAIRLAHRISYEIHKEPIPDGLFVCHHCDNPLCVNPDHLFVGNHKDNMVDMVQKGRQAKGSAQGNSKLTEEQVWEIFHAEGLQKEIAARYGVQQKYVSQIKRKERWGWLHED